MSFYSLQGKQILVIGLLAGSVLSAGCSSKDAPQPSSVKSEEKTPTTETTATPGAVQAPQKPAETTTAPTARGVVLANKELGMAVTGPGAGNPGRSVDELERQVGAFLPELRDAYERVRAQDPALLGSLDVTMTIEPKGEISDLRFPVKRVSNERLTSAVFDQMRGWIFPQTELPAQLRFTLLFVPPGMDEASILLWEKRLGGRPVIEKTSEASAPVAVAETQAPEKGAREENGKNLQKKPLAPASTQASVAGIAARSGKGKNQSEEITGWYRVLYPSVLRAEPQESAAVVARLRKDVRVRVVHVIKGQWLEVRSVSDRPSGFLWSEDAIAERENRAERQ
ncbi:MAG: hypothetical protein HY267_08305 [Deltaproteobacteria bacterium]|nr:hypothetical protein [Deltaproteobacteria bacterium]